MSPEYKAELAIPFRIVVTATDKEEAEQRALDQLKQELTPAPRQGAPATYDEPLLSLVDEAVVLSAKEIEEASTLPNNRDA